MTLSLSLPLELGFPTLGMLVSAQMVCLAFYHRSREQIYSPFKTYDALCTSAEFTGLCSKTFLGRCSVDEGVCVQISLRELD